MPSNQSQSPNDPNSEVPIDNLLKLISPALTIEGLLKLISDAVCRAYRIYSHRPNPEDVKDIAQAIAVLLIKDGCRVLCSFEHRSSPETWLQAIANHYVLRFLRGQKDTVDPEDLPPDNFAYQPGLEEDVLLEEVNRLLDEVSGKLTKRQRKLLELVRQELDREEIAKRMGIKPDSVSKSEHRLFYTISEFFNRRGGGGAPPQTFREDRGDSLFRDWRGKPPEVASSGNPKINWTGCPVFPF